MPRRLIVFVPGYQEKFSPGSQLAALKNHLLARSGGSSEPIAREPYAGYRIESAKATFEMFEANWQGSTPMLSAKGWFTRLTRGIGLLSQWMSPMTIYRARRHYSWFIWFALSLIIIAAWWASAVTALPKELGFPDHIGAVQLPTSPPWFVATMTAVLAAFGVSITASIDVADLFRRYLNDSIDDNGLPTRTVMRSALTEAINVLVSSAYEEVIIVAHSFGVLIALDAVVQGLPREVSLVSLGGFLGFLDAENGWVSTCIRHCEQSANLATWIDYYSSQDAFAAPSPLVASPKVKSRNIRLNASILDGISGRAHSMYFGNDEVRDTIMDPTRALA